MYSLEGDTVLDPFVGTGTTTLASIALGRNSVGYDADARLLTYARDRIVKTWRELAARNSERLDRHLDFIAECSGNGKVLQHFNQQYEFPVMTQQEVDLQLSEPVDLLQEGERGFEVHHRPLARRHIVHAQSSPLRQVEQPTLNAWQ